MKRTIRTILAAAALALAVPAPATAQRRIYEIHDNGGSRVQFVSDAPLETITGVSSTVSGRIVGDVADLSRVEGTVRVPVASLRTGIDLRDEHLRSDNWLDAGRYPYIQFDLRRVEGGSRLEPGQTARLRLHGRVTIHGRTRDVVARARVRYMPLTEEMRQAHIHGDVILVQARFTVRLSDFGVSVPAPVRLKVSDEIQVNVALRATAERSQG